jgi:hypothetical protein
VTILAVIGENVLTARGAAARGFIVRDEVGRWDLHARCTDATFAMSRGRGSWTVHEVDGPCAEAAGNLLLASAGEREQAATLMTAGHLVVAYQGTAAAASLTEHLAPSTAARADTPTYAGEVIVRHLIRYLSSRALSTDAALANVAFDLRRARELGEVAFVCSDGASVYAYAMGCSLNVARRERAIVIGTADVLPLATDVREMPSETMIVCRREPVLCWSVLLRGR